MQQEILYAIVVALIGYVLGSLSFSTILGKVFENTDIRDHGSGNAGATNTLRVLGKKTAAAVLLGDILKCLAAVLIGNMFVPVYGGWIAGICCMLGHVYPVFFGFKGGKGVATGIALMVFVQPFAGLSALLLFVIILIICKIVSVSSLCAFLVFPITVWLFTKEPLFVIIACAMFLFVAFLHRENIKRLFKGEEKKISFKSVKK